MSYCPVCKQDHDSTGCPSDRSVYDEAMDALAAKDAEIASLKKDNELMSKLNDSFPEEIMRLEDENSALKESVEFWKRENRLLNAAQIAAEERVKELEAENQQLREALEYIHEYWNGDYNDMAMRDALDKIMEITSEALMEAKDA